MQYLVKRITLDELRGLPLLSGLHSRFFVNTLPYQVVDMEMEFGTPYLEYGPLPGISSQKADRQPWLPAGVYKFTHRRRLYLLEVSRVRRGQRAVTKVVRPVIRVKAKSRKVM